MKSLKKKSLSSNGYLDFDKIHLMILSVKITMRIFDECLIFFDVTRSEYGQY